jgi:CubicO group peptidase (beta-lactamase class C family)
MILRAALLLSLPLATLPATAADPPRRAPPDRAAMSQFIATPLEPAGADNSRGVSRSDRKSKRVRYTIPAAKRM